MTNKQIDEMSRTIRNWLSDEGMYKDKLADDKSHFHFIVEFPQGSGRMIDIFQPKNQDDLILVANGLILTPHHLERLRDMNETERVEFIWDIRFGLLFRDSGFNMLPNLAMPERVDFIREIHYDGLNKNKLMEAVRENHRCNLFVMWKFMEQCGDILGHEPMSPMFG